MPRADRYLSGQQGMEGFYYVIPIKLSHSVTLMVRYLLAHA
jgi:hypothetical protein